MSKSKADDDIRARVEKEFPSLLLYTSPPEAESLRAWLREVEEKRRNTASQTEAQTGTSPKRE
jgi:hypothetical protein